MNNKHLKRGFTLIELLVVVLIIGILAAVALPQYQKAVGKSRITQIMPLMRHLYDALTLYKLEHGSYRNEDGYTPSFDELGVDIPSVFEHNEQEFWNDQWYCFPNEEATGYSQCYNDIHDYSIYMFQPDEHVAADAKFAGKRICFSDKDSGIKICQSLGGKEIEEGLWGYRAWEW